MEKKETVGQIVSALMQKEPDITDPIELQRLTEQDYIDNLIECVKRHKDVFEGDFYVVVESKKEALFDARLPIRCFFIGRQSCPTPEYDQSVFRYRRAQEEIEFLWTIPDQESCRMLQEHALDLPEDQKELLNFVYLYYDGSLKALAMKLNNETIDMPQVIIDIKES